MSYYSLVIPAIACLLIIQTSLSELKVQRLKGVDKNSSNKKRKSVPEKIQLNEV